MVRLPSGTLPPLHLHMCVHVQLPFTPGRGRTLYEVPVPVTKIWLRPFLMVNMHNSELEGMKVYIWVNDTYPSEGPIWSSHPRRAYMHITLRGRYGNLWCRSRGQRGSELESIWIQLFCQWGSSLMLTLHWKTSSDFFNIIQGLSMGTYYLVWSRGTCTCISSVGVRREKSKKERGEENSNHDRYHSRSTNQPTGHHCGFSPIIETPLPRTRRPLWMQNAGALWNLMCPYWP